MVWHILRKDLRLLWVFAVVVVALQFASAALRLWLDVAAPPVQLAEITPLLTTLTFLGMVVLAVSVMHQDAVPGVSQDWLVRPIRRRDLILAKFLFVLLIVQGPALLADLGGGLAHGFGFGASLEAALARNAALLCLITLPAMMLGAVTRSVTQFLVGTLMGLVAYVAIFGIGVLMLLRMRTSLGGTGLSWIIAATWYTLAIVGALAVVASQYLLRRTTAARWLVFAGGAAIIFSAFLPWRLAFAIQARLAPEPGAARAIGLAVDPQLGAFKTPSGAAGPRMVLYLPLRLTGIPSSALVLLDRADVQIRDTDGKLVYAGRTNLSVDGFGSLQDAQFEARQGREDDAAVPVYERIFLPAPVLAKLANRSVDLDIDYTLTLFRPQAVYSLPAVDGHGALGELGSCSTRIDGEGDDVQLRCMSIRSAPTCFTAYLEDPSARLRNPEVHVCTPDYSPFDGRFWPDSLTRSSGELPFFDRSGLAHFPIDGSKLPGSRFVIQTFVPRDHFVRHVRLVQMRLSDFLEASTVPNVHP